MSAVTLVQSGTQTHTFTRGEHSDSDPGRHCFDSFPTDDDRSGGCGDRADPPQFGVSNTSLLRVARAEFNGILAATRTVTEAQLEQADNDPVHESFNAFPKAER